MARTRARRSPPPRLSPSATTAIARAPHEATRTIVEIQGTEPARRLYLAFSDFNARYFNGELGSPLVLITGAQSARSLGDYIARDVHGLESRIRIAPKVLKRGELFALDVLLHEMVHAWQHEIDEDTEDGYRGHGPRFAARCNAIGAELGLPPVGVKSRDGLPDCAHWPLIVRPAGYYPEPFTPPRRKQKSNARDTQNDDADETGDADNERNPLDVLTHTIKRLTVAQLRKVRRIIDREFESRT